MPSPFGSQLYDALGAVRLSQREFCRLVDYNQGSLQAVLRGRRKPPKDAAARWADALQLRGAERDAFLESYLLAISPPGVADLVARLRAELARARRGR